jgi:zona occludens toxin
MSITLITGVPGSGKTLKAVYDHLRPYVGHVDELTDDRGTVVEIPSVVYTNINTLQLDHELIEGGGTWTKKGDDWAYVGNPEGLRNWHNWAKPGAKIFFDEFQKFWPPRPNGSAVPPDIQALDTHRHMGVDFVLITQNCMNVDRHILGLVDRHLHVRRVANMPLAVVYEWDHASKTLNYKNSMTKSPWRYPRKAYKLYKSAELHTKQKRKMPGVVWFILAGLCGAAYGFPALKDRLTDRIAGQSSSAPADAKNQTSGVTTYEKDGYKYTVETKTEPAPVGSGPQASGNQVGVDAPAPVAQPATQFSGCIRVRSRCSCFDTAGFKVKVEESVCLDNSASSDAPKALLSSPNASVKAFSVDGSVLADMRPTKPNPAFVLSH